jgi:shikimate dehydrogenase
LRLAVIGDPVDHSRSPDLHRAFLAEAGIAGSYERIRVAAGEGARAIEQLRARGYCGLNVTTPLKEEAFARAERHDATALATGSVNTLLLGATIEGHNTDGIGTLGVLADAGLGDPSGSNVLVLGVGPTARSAIVALRLAGAAVWVWNRTAARGAESAERLGVRSYTADAPVDAVFSALPPGAAPDDPAVRLALLDATIFVDANYGERATLAAALGRTGQDGTRMLEHSARAAFDLWYAARAASSAAP